MAGMASRCTRLVRLLLLRRRQRLASFVDGLDTYDGVWHGFKACRRGGMQGGIVSRIGRREAVSQPFQNCVALSIA